MPTCVHPCPAALSRVWGAALVTVTYRSLVIDKCAPCQGVWLDCDEFLFFGEALERVLDKDHWLLGTLKRILT
jgi:Zn-finger nucleic acid-binding protein